ncbi:MAG: hypothetical protein AB7I27_13895 [Bacteriovoracaceae bacterium]|jgi:hypothetical protein
MKDSEQDKKDDSNKFIICGLSLGSFATASVLLTGAACPMCIIAAPALLATGVYKKVTKSSKPKKQASS